jgi:dCTP deaminase
MSILSDRSIIQLCQQPSHQVNGPERTFLKAWEGVTHTPDQLDQLTRQLKARRWDPLWSEEEGFRPMIKPFVDHQVKTQLRMDKLGGTPVGELTVISSDNVEKIVSYGLSSYGYDVRLGREFKIFTNVRNGTIDPLNPDPDCFVDHVGGYCIIPPNSYILGHTMETFDIPQDIMVMCVGKSTYARLAAIVNVTPIEPGFKGQVVIEIANCSTLPLKVYAGQGIAQFLFLKGDQPCMTSYADKAGKYQNQQGVTTARL